MVQKFYLHDASNSLGGTFPTGEQSASVADVTWTGANTLKTMDGSIGALQAGPTQASLNQTASQKHFVRFYASPKLAAGTHGAGTWIFNCADQESNTNANFWIDGLNIYFWRPSTGAKVGTVIDTTDALGGLEPTAANSEQVTRFTFTGSGVAIQDGDVLIVEVWATFAQGMAVSYTLTFYFNGTTENDVENTVVSNHASFLNAPADIPLAPLAPARVTAEEVTLDYNIAARVTAEEITLDYNVPARVTAEEITLDYNIAVPATPARVTAVEVTLDYLAVGEEPPAAAGGRIFLDLRRTKQFEARVTVGMQRRTQAGQSLKARVRDRQTASVQLKVSTHRKAAAEIQRKEPVIQETGTIAEAKGTRKRKKPVN